MMSKRKVRFPGFDDCMKMMRKSDPHVQEEGFHWLRPYAAEFLDKLIAEFESEQNHGLKCWLLELVGEAKSPSAIPLLAAHLKSEDESLKSWAITGLKNLDTKEARKLLWEAQQGPDPR